MSAVSDYDTHIRTFSARSKKPWHEKASSLALKVGGPLHDNLAHFHYKDSGGKPGGWLAFRSRHVARKRRTLKRLRGTILRKMPR